MEKQIMTEIAGVEFNNSDGTDRKKYIKKLKEGDALDLIHSPKKDHPEAIEIYTTDGRMLGYVPKYIAVDLHKIMKAGIDVQAEVFDVDVYNEGKDVTCEIEINIIDGIDSDEIDVPKDMSNRQKKVLSVSLKIVAVVLFVMSLLVMLASRPLGIIFMIISILVFMNSKRDILKASTEKE